MTKPKKTKGFHLDIFQDMYDAIEKECGKKWALEHVSFAGFNAAGNEDNSLRVCGSKENLRVLCVLIILRLAQEYQAEAEDMSGLAFSPDLKVLAKEIVASIVEDINNSTENNAGA